MFRSLRREARIWFFVVFALVVLVQAVAFVAGRASVERSKEWTLPARFEAQGAFTAGCSLWSVPLVTDRNDVELNYLIFGQAPDGRYTILAGVDFADQHYLITGTICGMSVDWSSFPDERRAKP